MLALLLAQNIAALFVMIAVGFVLVRTGVLKPSDSKVLSTVLIYVLAPCMVIVSFEVDFSIQLAQGLAFAFVAALLMQLLPIALVKLLEKPLKLDPLERANCIYSNCANLIIPLIIATLGQEWVIYSLAFLCVSVCFMFTHGESLVSGTKRFGIKQILTNANIIAVALGLLIFLTGFRLPGPIEAAAVGLSNMLGPVAMLVAGMAIGGAKAKDVVANKRVWLVTILRLVIIPVISCLILKAADLSWLVPDASSILLVTLLAASAPCASMMVQFALIHNKDSAYASAINVVSTLCCIITMPLMVALYQL